MSVELFRTVVPVPPSPAKITYHTGVLMLGSCFTENIGEKMHWYKFQVNINPFGIIYNPLSLKNSITRIIENKAYTKNDLIFHNGLYSSFDHHSKFSDILPDQCLERINTSLTSANRDLTNAGLLFITLGTAFYYELKETLQVVSNCHKFPDTSFTRCRMTVNDIVYEFKTIIDLLKSLNPELRIVFTVSPIRHWKDGPHENQLSKSLLLLAIDELINRYDHLFYFPAYELQLDELRDYRFYAEDMLHPNKIAIDFIWKRFAETFIDRNTSSIMGEVEKILLAKQHRPFNPESENFQNFVIQQLNKIDHITNQFPTIDLSAEYKYFRAYLE